MSNATKKEDVNSLIPFINKKLFDITPTDLSNTLEALFICSYDTGRFISGLSHAYSTYNPILMHNLEIKVRYHEFVKLNHLKRLATYYSVNTLATATLSVGPSVVIVLHQRHTLRRMQVLEQIYQKTLDNLRKIEQHSTTQYAKDIISPEIIEKQSVTQAFSSLINKIKFSQEEKRASLEKHTTRNDGFICADPNNPDKPFYIPQNAIDIQVNSSTGVNSNIKKSLLKQANHILKLSNAERAKYVESFVGVKEIDEQECRRLDWPLEMVGQKGMYAKKDIPAFHIIGFYSGLYFTEETSLNAYRKEAEQGYLTYVFGFPKQAFPRISGYMYGNDMTRINTATNYTGSAKEIAQKLFYVRNTFAAYVKTTEYPDQESAANPEFYDLVAYIIDKPVKKGTQILVDYGMQYWKLKNPKMTNATKEEIFGEYGRLNQAKHTKGKMVKLNNKFDKNNKSFKNKNHKK